jgi:hypothetical protein
LADYVSFDAVTFSTSTSFAHTIGSTATHIIVGVGCRDTDQSTGWTLEAAVNGVNWGGVALTEEWVGPRHKVFILAHPATGADTIDIDADTVVVSFAMSVADLGPLSFSSTNLSGTDVDLGSDLMPDTSQLFLVLGASADTNGFWGIENRWVEGDTAQINLIGRSDADRVGDISYEYALDYAPTSLRNQCEKDTSSDAFDRRIWTLAFDGGITYDLAGDLGLSGILSRTVVFSRSASGSVDTSGTLSTLISKLRSVAGTLSFSGGVTLSSIIWHGTIRLVTAPARFIKMILDQDQT